MTCVCAPKRCSLILRCLHFWPAVFVHSPAAFRAVWFRISRGRTSLSPYPTQSSWGDPPDDHPPLCVVRTLRLRSVCSDPAPLRCCSGGSRASLRRAAHSGAPLGLAGCVSQPASEVSSSRRGRSTASRSKTPSCTLRMLRRGARGALRVARACGVVPRYPPRAYRESMSRRKSILVNLQRVAVLFGDGCKYRKLAGELPPDSRPPLSTEMYGCAACGQVPSMRSGRRLAWPKPTGVRTERGVGRKSVPWVCRVLLRHFRAFSARE